MKPAGRTKILNLPRIGRNSEQYWIAAGLSRTMHIRQQHNPSRMGTAASSLGAMPWVGCDKLGYSRPVVCGPFSTKSACGKPGIPITDFRFPPEGLTADRDRIAFSERSRDFALGPSALVATLAGLCPGHLNVGHALRS